MAVLAAEGSAIDALGQFRLGHGLGEIGGAVNFTNANEIMLLAGAVLLGLLYFGMKPRAIVPGRLQALVEYLHDFIYNMCLDQIGEEGKRFFPFIFTLFTFILIGNLLGLFPYFFTFTSHIMVTGALAILVIVLVTLVALRIHGLRFFTYFFPAGVPKLLAPLIIPIEILSYLSRPVSLSIRLFANMTAGHVMFEVFASFMIMLVGALGAFGYVLAVAPLAINIALMGFEILVAFLQAYVFAILTCIYLHDAVHLH